MNKILSILVISLLGSMQSFTQITLGLQNFEVSGSTMGYTVSGGSLQSGNSAAADRPASSPFFVSSDNGYRITNGTATLTFDNISGLGSYTNKQVSFRLASFSINSASNGADAGDEVTLSVSFDNGLNYSDEILIKGNGNAYWSYAGGDGIANVNCDTDNVPVEFAPGGGGDRDDDNDGYTFITLNLPPSTSQVRIRITLFNNSNGEAWLIDDVKVIGYTPLHFYSKSTGDLELTSSWGSNTDGTGTQPTDFISDNQVFNIRNNATPTIGAAWTVSGAGSYVNLGDGINPTNFTVPSGFAFSGDIDVNNSATLTLQNASLPNLKTCAANSTVDFGGSTNYNIPKPIFLNYGNIKTSGTGSRYIFSNLNILGNIDIGAGTTLSFDPPSGSLVLDVNGNILVNGTMNSVDNAHSMFVGGDITVNAGGWFDMTTPNITLTFDKNGNQTISGSGTVTLYDFTVNMGTSQSNILDIQSVFTMPNNGLTLLNGTFKVSSASAILPKTSSFTIPATAGIWNNGSTMSLNGGITTVNGLLRLSSGILNIGNSSGEDLEYATGSSIMVEGGNMNIAGGLMPDVFASSTTTFNQSNGTITCGINGNGDANRGMFDIRNAGSSFTLSGGNIIIQRMNSVFSGGDYINLAGTHSITGGTLNIGNTSTAVGQTIDINSTVPIHNLVINATNTPTARLLTNNLTVKNDVTANGSLNLNNLSLNIAGAFLRNGGSFIPGTGTVTFNGSSQTLGGTIPTTFHNVIIDNTGTGVNLTNNTFISNLLTLTDGIFTTSTNYIGITNNATNAISGGSNDSYIHGNLRRTISTTPGVYSFPVGGTSNYAPVDLEFIFNASQGTLEINSNDGDHPNINTSDLNESKSVNRYWKIINFTLTNFYCDATFNWQASDNDAGFDFNSMLCGKYNSPDWTYPPVMNNMNTTAKLIGLDAFSDFQFANSSCTAPGFTSCPVFINQNNDLNICSALVNYSVVADGDPTPDYTFVFSGDTNGSGIGTGSGSMFNVGLTNVSVNANNGCDPSAVCSFSINIIDSQFPSISCPSNIVISNDANNCSAVVNYTAPVGTDNCPGQSTMQTTGLTSGAAFPVGITTNTFEVTDAANNMASCSFTVTVNDTQNPAISCPANINVSNDANNCSAVVNYTAPVGTDNCPGQSTMQTTGLSSGAAFPVGVTTNTFKVTDAANNMNTCSFTVTVNDAQNPTISCPSNIIISNDANNCSAVVNYTAPVGTDNCPGQSTMQTTGLTSGAAFPVGITTNTFEVTDAANNMASCSFTVTVNDTQNPAIYCPSNINVSNDANNCSAVVNYTAPIGTDNCPGQSTMQTTGLTSGAAFPVGITTNTFEVTDAANNMASCSFTVTVNDTQNPAISCPSNIIISNDANNCSAIVNYTAPVGTDNCPGQSTMQTTGLASGAAFPVGLTTNTFEVTDAANNMASCSFTVTVNDTQNPAISCPSNIIISNDANNCSAVVNYTAPIGTDNCPGQSTMQTTGLASGAAFPVGVTTNTFEVTDAANNMASCSFTVTVNDTQNPAISCPSNINVSNDANNCSAVVNYTAPIGTDNCPGQTTMQTTGLASGAAFPVGVTTNTFEVTDAANNMNTCSFTVTVNDAQNPAISCPSNIIISNDANNCSAVVNYTAPVGTDNCPGQSTMQTTGLTSGAAFPVGITTNTFEVTDAANNMASCSFTVTVNDTQNPAISCPSNINVSNDANNCSAVVNYTAPVGTDNCPGQSTMQTTGLTSGAAFPVGITTNTFEVTDAANNMNTCSFTVTVNDAQNPAISCPSNIIISNDANNCSAVVNYTAPVGTDNCPGQSTMQTTGLTSGAAFPVGITTNTFEVTDAANNMASCSFTVTVNDTQNPAISCPANIYVSNDANNCSAVVNYTAPIGTDNCPGQTTMQTTGLASGAAFPVGLTTNTFEVTDAANNMASCSFTVTVNDTQNPAISCPSNIIIANDANNCSAVVNYTAPVGTDNCPGQSTMQTTGLASGAAFPVGVTTNTFKVTDAANNMNTCSFAVTVNDTQNPAITCPSNIVISNDPGLCSAIVIYTPPSGTDNCPGQMTTQTTGFASGTPFPVGLTTNTFKVTDAANNMATCSFTVTVNDTQNPSITCPSNIVVSNDPGLCGAIVFYTAPSGTDNCPGQSTVRTTGFASGTPFPVGVTTNTFKVTDAANNMATCSFTVTVNDTQNPSITCPSNIVISNDPGLCGAIVIYTPPSGTDNCPGQMTTQTTGFASGTPFPVGLTTNTFKVTDAANNMATCSFTVTVNDTQNPSITCPSNIVISNDPGLCGAIVFYTAPSGTDNCPGQSTVRTTGFASGTAFPVGVTTNTFKVTDAANNMATCSFTVTVNDTQNPSITCPSNIVVSNDANNCSAVVNYTAPIGTDNCPGHSTVRTNGLASGAAFPVGVTTNTFKVTDAANNMATCSFTVIVNDTQNPAISCPANSNRGTTEGLCEYVIMGNEFNYTGSDNCGIISSNYLLSGATSGSGANSLNNIHLNRGMTTIQWNVMDLSENIGSCSFNVTIVDNEPPSISCPPNLSLITDPDKCFIPSGSVDLGVPVVSDNCGVKFPLINNSPSSYPVGVTNVKWTVKDSANNKKSCVQKVTVTPYTCGSPVTVYHHDTSWNSAKVSWSPGFCATLYQLRIRREIEPGVWTPWTSWENSSSPLSHQFTDLEEASFYHYQLRSKCGTSNSTIVNGWFHTLSASELKKIKNIIDVNSVLQLSETRNEDKTNSGNWNISAYPNPAQAYMIIKITGLENINKWIEIRDVYGKLILKLSPSVTLDEFELDLNNLALTGGVYLLSVKTDNDIKSILLQMTGLKE